MIRLIVVVGILGVVAAASYYAQRERTQPGVDPAPLVNVVGDVQRTIARVPASATRMSDAEEIAVGNTLAATQGYTSSAELGHYVSRVGADVASGARRRLPYTFHVLASPRAASAFALPGGHVFIGAGLMALMTTEDELAAVLAHEIEHIDHYHCADRYQSARVVRGAPVAGAIAALPLALFEAGYSKTQELEADAEGARLAAVAGYSPLAAVTLLEAMEHKAGSLRRGEPRRRSRSPIDETLTLPVSALNAYFRSHPSSTERIARIRDVVRDDRLDATRATRPLEQTAARGVQRDVTSRHE